jgi:eukaryotic-like serine/threonine-protein kinase
MTLTAGTKLGSYEILGAIGAGGMGEVYRAHDSKLGRDVALKVLPETFARDGERLARFQREAKVLASLNHPNIASIYGLEDSGATHALVMELVEGPTLADRIKSGPIPIDEALRIAKQICEALEYAHERGIVHRDLKPANVKVTNDDAVKVLDFGLAKALESDASSIDISTSPTISRMATQAGVLLGTAAYMSPEQAKGKPVDRRADIWAFGCVLYEMLTGKMAFTGETVTDTLAAVIMKDPDWAQLPTATPTHARLLLQRCLQKDPKQRLRDVGDARIALDEVLSGTAPQATPSFGTAVAVPFWRRALLPWALLAAAAIALAALASVHLREKPVIAEAVELELPLPDKAVLSTGGSFGLSPDGRQFAFFAAGPDGVDSLWIRAMGSFEARMLPDSDSLAAPPSFWSPDSRYIVFDGGRKLKKIDVSGGAVETLCDLSGYAVGGSWNRDGVIIFGSSPGVIMRTSANGGPATPLTALDSSRGEIQHVLPSFLPDGRHFLYLRTSSKPENSGVYIGSLDAKPEEQDTKRLLATTFGVIYVPSSDPDLGQLLFLRDGTLMAQSFDTGRREFVGEPAMVAQHLGAFREFGFFSASTNGVLAYRVGGSEGDRQLTWFDPRGKALGTVGERGVYYTSALAPDSTRAVVRRQDPQIGGTALWMIDFSRGTSTRFTFGSSIASDPIWSPDGKLIVFTSNAGGRYDLYRKPANSSQDEELLLKSGEGEFPTSFSRDGRFLLYTSVDPKTNHDLWVLPLEGDKKPFPFLRTQYNETDGHFSPDGHWVAYQSDESGRDEIDVREFSPDSTAGDAGGKWQVSYGGGTEPRWSADGKELYYMTLDWKLMAVDVTTKPTFQAGTPKLLFQAPPQSEATAGDYTVDGKRFLFVAPAAETAQASLTVVLNWQAGLKK